MHVRLVALLVPLALLAPAQAAADVRCGERDRAGFTVLYDGTDRCAARWRHAGGARMERRPGAVLRTAAGAPNLGLYWYAHRRYRDFVLRLRLRDDSPAGGPRANSGVFLRFPAPRPPVAGCPTGAYGENAAAWVAVECGHEIQVNDDDGGDPRKTGSVYGFADLDLARARPVPRGRWSALSIRVVGRRYTVRRDGVVINRYTASRRRSGHIGLQAHGAPHDVVSFRDIRILDLSDRD